MKISCAFFDLDGTLLNSKNRISETDLATLRDLSREGVKIVIATGRSVLQIKEYVATLGLSDPVITCNGGVILNPSTGEIIQEKFLLPSDAMTVLSDLRKEGADYLFYTRDYIYHAPNSKRIDFYKAYNETIPEEHRVPMKNASEYPEEAEYRNIHKLLISDDIEKIPQFYARWGGNTSLSFVCSGKGLIDVMRKETSKGRALKLLAEYFDIPISETVAFGDSPNDEEMLKAAGFSVAMGNASDDIKKIADFVTKSNDDFGITYAFDYIKSV